MMQDPTASRDGDEGKFWLGFVLGFFLPFPMVLLIPIVPGRRMRRGVLAGLCCVLAVALACVFLMRGVGG